MIRYSKKKFFEKILTNSKNSKDTWRAINLLTNKNSYANAMNGSDIFPDILKNHFCNVHSKVVTTDKSSNNSLTALKQYCKERIRHKGKPVPFMTVSGVFKSLCHLKQSSTKGADGMDGKKKKIPKYLRKQR